MAVIARNVLESPKFASECPIELVLFFPVVLGLESAFLVEISKIHVCHVATHSSCRLLRPAAAGCALVLQCKGFQGLTGGSDKVVTVGTLAHGCHLSRRVGPLVEVHVATQARNSLSGHHLWDTHVD